MIALILILSITILSAEEILTFEEIKEASKKNSSSFIGDFSEKRRLKKKLNETEKMLESYRYIEAQRIETPLIIDSNLIEEASYIGASTSLRILSTSERRAVVLSKLVGSSLPKDSKIVCEVFTKFRRICGECRRVIINGQGYDIDASLYNKDGSSCVIGKISDEKEKYLVGMTISEMASGALTLSQSTLPTPSGNIIQNTAGNQIKQGLINVGGEATEMFKEEYRTSEPIVTLPKDSRVLIYFKKEFKL